MDLMYLGMDLDPEENYHEGNTMYGFCEQLLNQ